MQREFINNFFSQKSRDFDSVNSVNVRKTKMGFMKNSLIVAVFILNVAIELPSLKSQMQKPLPIA